MSDVERSGLVAVVALALLAGGFWLAARAEAVAYERVTGVRVSTWDALFLDLRVQEPANRGGR